MNQLKVFIETVFYNADSELFRRTDWHEVERFADMSADEFVDAARITSAKVLNDDAIRLIYRLYDDCWAIDSESGVRSILNPICNVANSMLRTDGRKVKVRYQKLFDWRDFTRWLGEDIYITAFLAYKDRDSKYRNPARLPYLEYEPTLRNDDPQIESFLRHHELHELHSHLKASAKVFDISWVCLMNHPAGRGREFGYITRRHDRNDFKTRGEQMLRVVGNAAALRFNMHRLLIGDIGADRVRQECGRMFDGLFADRFQQLEADISAFRMWCAKKGATCPIIYVCRRSRRKTPVTSGYILANVCSCTAAGCT